MADRWEELIEHTRRREDDLRGELAAAGAHHARLARILELCTRSEARAAAGLTPRQHVQFSAYAALLERQRRDTRGRIERCERRQEDLRTDLVRVHRRRRSLELLRAREQDARRTRERRRERIAMDELVLHQHLERGGGIAP